MASTVGHRFPAYCTALGKAMLAEFSRERVTELLRDTKMRRRTPTTMTTLAALHADLEATRNRGYSIDDEENEDGARCVGAVVRDHAGKPVGAISVSAPAFRMNKVKVAETGRLVMEAAMELSAELGYRGVHSEAITAAV